MDLVKKLVDILYNEGQMNGFKYLIDKNPDQFGDEETDALAESRAITRRAIQLLKENKHADDDWSEIMLYVLAKGKEAKNSVIVNSDISPGIRQTNDLMHAAFNQIQAHVSNKKYNKATERMQDVAKWMIATKNPGIGNIEQDIQTNLRTMRRLLSEVEGSQWTAVDSPEVRSIDLYLSVSELHTILEEVNNQFRLLGEHDRDAKNAEVTESLRARLEEITQLKERLQLSHDLQELKDPDVLHALDAAAKRRMSNYLTVRVDELIDAVPPVAGKEDNKKTIGELRNKIQKYLSDTNTGSIELIEKNSVSAAKDYAFMASIYYSTNWQAVRTIVELEDFIRFSERSVGEWKHENQHQLDELVTNSNSTSSITVNPPPITAASHVVPPVAPTNEAFQEILDTETFPDDNVTADLFKFALPINQATPLSDPSLRIHKETMDLLNQLSSYGIHPFFKFNYKQGNVFEIEVKKGSILTYHKPIEIAKVIYGLMHHSETKQIKYPAEIASTQSAALSTLVADINNNFKVLQGELDQLKPKTIKRITEKVFGNPMAKKVGHETRSLPSKSNATKHQQRLAQLRAQVELVLAAKADYNGQRDKDGKLELKADGTPVKKGLKNHHNFYVIETEAENLKRLMREIKREDHSPSELKEYNEIVAPAQKWSIGKHLFRTVRHAIWDGGKRTRRLRKKK